MESKEDINSPISVSHVTESLRENFCIKQEGEPFLVHIDLSNLTCTSSYISIGDIRFNINALRYDATKAEEKVKRLKADFIKSKPHVQWNETWERKALELFSDSYRRQLATTKITSIRKSELINGKNRLVGLKDEKIIKDCKALGELNFRWIKDIRGDGNCYYRSVMCGYIETLLTENPEYMEAYIQMIKKGNKVFSFQEKTEKMARESILPVLERLKTIRKKLGVQKALQEYFLESISADELNYVVLCNSVREEFCFLEMQCTEC